MPVLLAKEGCTDTAAIDLPAARTAHQVLAGSLLS
jgi:hypothetical protein